AQMRGHVRGSIDERVAFPLRVARRLSYGRATVEGDQMTRNLLVLLLAPSLALAGGPTLDRDVKDYFALGIRQTRLKNLTVDAPGCNVGVNCPHPAFSSCGTLRGKGAVVNAPGQLVGDDLCATGSFFEVFRNGGACAPGCSNIASPGSAGDCT